MLDTNVFVLRLVGWLDPQLLSKIKRTAQFGIDDWALLNNLLSLVPTVLVTPCILTECCNLLDGANQAHGLALFEVLRKNIVHLKEDFVRSKELALGDVFLRFGLADASLADLAQRGHLVITDDLPLQVRLNSLSLPVLNFNHLRSADWIR